MNIAIKPSKATKVRALKEAHPYLTAQDIAATTGINLREVNGALKRRPKMDRPKSRLG